MTAADLAVPLLGGVATIFVAYLSIRLGAQISVGLLVSVVVFVAAVTGFISYPHLAVAATVVLFAFVPTLKVFVFPEIGAVKDLVVLAAVLASAIIFAFERRSIDRPVLLLVATLLGLYLINVGSGHGIAWAQGVRLVGEPLLLLLVGLTLPEPRRTFRWALGALVATACVVAAYGILQQVVGKYTLIDWGYSYESQVRTLYTGRFRSFGTLDDPFTYAAFLLAGLVGIFFWVRRSPLAWGAGLLILAGIGVSFSKTAIVILVALVGLVLTRWGYKATAVLAVTATVLAGGVTLVKSSGTESSSHPTAVTSGNTVAAGSANVILNGRISAWEAALGTNPWQWLLGRGVGEVGTAATRAQYTFAAPSNETSDPDTVEAVDSGYLATIADVGFAGLAVLIALLGRLVAMAVAAARRREEAGWVALGLLAVLMLDALSRSTFTGFPAAYLGLLVVGVCLAATQEKVEPPTVPMAANGT